jgi:hypothetical protein
MQKRSVLMIRINVEKLLMSKMMPSGSFVQTKPPARKNLKWISTETLSVDKEQVHTAILLEFKDRNYR